MPATKSKPQEIASATVQRALAIEAGRRQREEEAARGQHQKYIRLLDRIMGGEDIAPEDILAECDECGVKPHALQSNVEQLGELGDKVDRLTQQPALRDRQVAIRKETTSTEKQIEDLKERLENLCVEETSTTKKLNEISQLRHELRRLLPSEIANDVRAIEGEIRDAQARSDKAAADKLRAKQDALLARVAEVGVVVGAE